MSNITNDNAEYCIIDTEEEELTIYNNLGCWAFSSAPALCDLLNELYEKSEQLIKENEQLQLEYKELRYANNIYCEAIDKLKKRNNELQKENEDLKNELEFLNSFIEFDTL